MLSAQLGAVQIVTVVFFMDNLWQNFVSTGSVSDYLKYKQSENKNEVVQTDADKNKGTYNQRTDGGGER